MRQDILPPEFEPISNLVNYVVKRTQNEFSGSCPKCGGSVHKNGELPDRFRMWVRSKYGFSMGWCRACNYIWSPSKDHKPTKEEMEAWQTQQIEVEKERLAAAERALELLQSERMWERFFVQNNDYSRNLFRERGLADSWVEYLKLGLVPDYTVRSRENGEWGYYHSPAITHPIWGVGGVVQNIKLRVTNPKTSADRYRNWYESGQSYLHIPLYDLPLVGAGIIVEGEFKGDVLEQTLDDVKYRVVSVQSKTPSHELFGQLKDLDPVYIWLDPDAFIAEFDKNGKPRETPVERMVRIIGKDRSRVVNSPIKVDDGIVKYGLNPMSYIRMARKA